MKAIETIYSGCRFRSRLEARWAVFFDALGIQWEYEKEGYQLEDGTWYLPDFWLPKQKYWIEIKGSTNAVGYDNVFKLSETTGYEGFVISGEIPYVTNESDFSEFTQIDPGSDEGYTWCECPDCRGIGIEWAGYSDRLGCKQCEICYVIEHRKTCLDWKHPRNVLGGRTSRGCFQCCYVDTFELMGGVYEECPIHKDKPHNGCPPHSAKMSKHPNYDSPRLIAAYTAARQARFEHGEKP